MPSGKHSQDEYLVYFSEFSNIKFTEMSGGEATNDTTVQHNGGGDKEVIEGPSEVSEVTVQKPYDHLTDAPLDQWNRAWQNGVRRKLTLIRQPVNSEGVPVGEADTYVGCARTSYSKPDVSKGSSDTAMLEISVQPEEMK